MANHWSTLKNIRQSSVDEAQTACLSQQKLLADNEASIQSLDGYISDYHSELINAEQNSALLDVIIRLREFIQQLYDMKKAQRQKSLQLQQEMHQKQQHLNTCLTELKVIEKIEEREKEALQAFRDYQEMRENEEIARQVFLTHRDGG
ncbi:MAG: flagellar FliJ family protein [Methylococcales bacterium]|mgnify:FL=1|jgi:flagellar export protein FliJ|nr:flagellar FliJ family protein [Methylococcales bacterium]MBT4347800.1 flagellar FliJ family protein [Methylococcales bacterium]MBT4600006.1 flagellar FliJ family protein [Methylococcales bacterium]MBT7575888.1 flagellar FliJ family protein [Methylococcales bacterium]